MIKVNVQKNLIGLEDLLVGIGTVSQNRGPTGTAPVTITKINGSNMPYDAQFSMKQKFDALQQQIDTLPNVVDENGNMLTGLLSSSTFQLDLANRLWRKEIDADTAAIYYGDELLFEYDPIDGNIYIPGSTDYIAADAVVTSAFQSADAILQNNIDTVSTNLTALDTAITPFKNKSIGTNANNIVELDDNARLPAIDGSQLTGIEEGIKPGIIVWTAAQTADEGFLLCDGSAVSRTTYSALFARIGTTFGSGNGSTTFNLPDTRGYFIRGFDDNAGRDSGRQFGSIQQDQLQNHTHGVRTGWNNGGTSCHRTTREACNGSLSILDTIMTGIVNVNAGGGSPRFGSETRPKNIALNAQIKV